MYKPREVDQAVIAIWLSLGICVVSAIVSKWMNYISESYFIGVVIFYAVWSLFPYLISRGSNTARWFYTILSAISLILFLGLGFADMPPPEAVATVITIPITIFAIVRLFQESSTDWFEQERSSGRPLS